MQITVIEFKNGKRVESTMELDISPELQASFDKEREWWKKQEAMAGDCKHDDVRYYGDGEHHECAKHCWACCSCGAVVQVG